MSSSKWVADDEDVLLLMRESGDGESKEASPHTSASEDDNQDNKGAVGERRGKDRRMMVAASRIPVWNARVARRVKRGVSTSGGFGGEDILEAPEGFRSGAADVGGCRPSALDRDDDGAEADASRCRSLLEDDEDGDEEEDAGRGDLVVECGQEVEIDACRDNDQEIMVSITTEASNAQTMVNAIVTSEYDDGTCNSDACERGGTPVAEKCRSEEATMVNSAMCASGRVGGSDLVPMAFDEEAVCDNGANNEVPVSLDIAEEVAAESATTASGRDAVNGPNSSASDVGGAFACAQRPPNEQTPTTTEAASIDVAPTPCAQAPRCSRIFDVVPCAAPPSEPADPAKLLPNSVEDELRLTEKCQCPTPPTYHHYQTASSSQDFRENETSQDHLVWEFKNGRLVFGNPSPNTSGSPSPQNPPQLLKLIETCSSQIQTCIDKIDGTNSDSVDPTTLKEVLSSRDLNRRTADVTSRLKRLEIKLKRAGITDGKERPPKCPDDPPIPPRPGVEEDDSKQVVDKLAGAATWSRCEFDARRLGDDPQLVQGADETAYYAVYDELDDEDVEDDGCEQCEHCRLIVEEMRGGGGGGGAESGGGNMGTNGEQQQQHQQQHQKAKHHNPDKENLKSLLKKPGGRARDGGGSGGAAKKNRVVFNENKNEFFDADYIILIREECDYDDEEDDGVCTCNEHEMVRLTCCEPNCNCNLYEGGGGVGSGGAYPSDATPQSPKFAPPLEFVDAVTLSPPEGYKDMELGEQQLLALQQMAQRRGQTRTAVCRDCSATHDDEGEGSQSDNEDNAETQSSDHEDALEETQKTDQSQQTTPTTPPASETDNADQHRYILETVSIATEKENRTARQPVEPDQQRSMSPVIPAGGSPMAGILKGGRLWKQSSQELNNTKNTDPTATDSSVTSDEETNGNSKRSVRFIEAKDSSERDSCDGEAEKASEETTSKQNEEDETKQRTNEQNSANSDATEMMLTFKLGNNILIANNSLKPNSAMRQLFPCTKPLSGKPGESDSVHQYLVTSESLRAFEEAKRSKLPQIIQSDDTDESIKRAIERNTLRRSLIRYEPRPKKKEQKTENSLVERIKQLTCDVDDVDVVQEPDDISQRASPPGEEARNSPEVHQLSVKNPDKSFSPSSSSTASSNSSSVSSTYKKITDLFSKREKPPDIQNNVIVGDHPKLGPAPDLGNSGGGIVLGSLPDQIPPHHCSTSKLLSSNESRKQFLSTLAPLTACVTGTGADEHFYHLAAHHVVGDRSSITSNVGTEYSLEDIDEGLKKEEEETKRNAPDVVVGTPSASESGDELAMFVQQDAGRIERIKKKYQQDNVDDDEHDDYGFNKRPSVRGIKPRFGTTTEILQQIQNQMQPPHGNQKLHTQINWPYYSEASLSNLDNNKSRNINQNIPQYQYTYVSEEMKTKMYVQQYRAPNYVDDNVYQNCANQRCNRDANYKGNVNHHVHSPVMRIGGGCNEAYHPAVSSKSRNGRPESPPPFDVAKNIHQTMVYIPYNHIESYQPGCVSPNPQYVSNDKCYARIVNQNQLNNRYIEPVYLNQPRVVHPHVIDDTHYQMNVMKPMPKPMMRLPYPLPASSSQPTHLLNTRSESPLPGQFSTARSTQTSAPIMSTCNNYYPRYRPVVGPVVSHAGIGWTGPEGIYSTKINRHSFPTSNVPNRYPAPDTISLTDSESQYNGPLPNGFRQCIETTFPASKDSAPSSPTKTRFIERGAPEGAASVSPQDSIGGAAQTTSTMTSPTSPQNSIPGNPKPMFYAMNV